jgi:hypothetical protein
MTGFDNQICTSKGEKSIAANGPVPISFRIEDNQAAQFMPQDMGKAK